MTKKITIITTRQNFKWISMQEVLPSLEQCWPETAVANSYEYKLINIDEHPLRSIMSFLLQSDAIVIIAFNETIAKFMREVRVKMQLPIPFIFHLHGLATIALWPFDHFKIMDSLTTGDAFIGTCEGDRHCLDLIFENHTFYRIPYPFYPLDLKPALSPFSVFVYIGRLSDQKNIEALVNAYHLLCTEDQTIPDFHIYGAEDFLGSPNMAIASSECLEELEILINSLNLDEKIIFKGFKTREEIFSEIGGNHIALSASTHSDENFGMAIMRSLSLGATAVITLWGGHIHFKEQFPESVITVPVSIENGRPQPDLFALKEAMKKALLIENPDAFYLRQNSPDYFKPENVGHKFKKVLDNVHFSETKLSVRPEIRKLFQQKNKFTEDGQIQRIYESYSDLMAIRFLSAYK
jgi:glycosyltransferase involved in cell wall biosynthesis